MRSSAVFSWSRICGANKEGAALKEADRGNGEGTHPHRQEVLEGGPAGAPEADSHESPDDIRLTGLLLHQEYRVVEFARLTRLDLERVKERLQHFLRHALIEIVEG